MSPWSADSLPIRTESCSGSSYSPCLCYMGTGSSAPRSGCSPGDCIDDVLFGIMIVMCDAMCSFDAALHQDGLLDRLPEGHEAQKPVWADDLVLAFTLC